MATLLCDMLALDLVLVGLLLQSADPEPPPCIGFRIIYFDSGSAAITARGSPVLDEFVELLKQSATPSRVNLAGRTDSLGTAEANLRLARRRAEAVRSYLIARGIARSLISIEVVGERQLRVETADEVSEPDNRSVDLEERLNDVEFRRREAIYSRTGRPQIVC